MKAPPPLAMGPTDPASSGRTHSFQHFAMACDWELRLACEDRSQAAAAARAAFEDVDRLERELSRFVPTSDIARLNTQPVGVPLRLGIDALTCLRRAVELSRVTAGAFDVTVGGLLIDRPLRGPHAPLPEAESSAPRVWGIDQLRLDVPAGCVTRLVDGPVIDLGAIGKGYAVEQAMQTLSDWGMRDALVHSGQSTVLARGSAPGVSGWPIALRDPRAPARTIANLNLRDQSVSGSGVRLHGKHIIDPRNGLPAQRWEGTWALTDSSAESDALSTAFMAMDLGEIERCCAAFGGVHAAVLAVGADGVRWIPAPPPAAEAGPRARLSPESGSG